MQLCLDGVLTCFFFCCELVYTFLSVLWMPVYRLFSTRSFQRSNRQKEQLFVWFTFCDCYWIWVIFSMDSSSQGDACSELDKHFLLRSPPLAFSRSDIFSYRCSFFFFGGSLTHKFVNTEILFTQLLILKFFFFHNRFICVCVCVYLFDYICTYNT